MSISKKEESSVKDYIKFHDNFFKELEFVYQGYKNF